MKDHNWPTAGQIAAISIYVIGVGLQPHHQETLFVTQGAAWTYPEQISPFLLEESASSFDASPCYDRDTPIVSGDYKPISQSNERSVPRMFPETETGHESTDGQG
jgi:hypothetical protein